MSNADLEINSLESWDNARALVDKLNQIPSSFQSTIRSLINDSEKNNHQMTPGTKFMAGRLLKGKTLLAPFYFAALTYKKENLEDIKQITTNDLLKVFTPIETAALFSVIYYYKKIKSLCDENEWSFIRTPLCKELDAVGLIGDAIPKIGLKNALMCCAFRYTSLGFFMRNNLKVFQEYRRSFKGQKTLFNINLQMKHWGCTDLQISAVFMQALGFGIDYSNNFTIGLSNLTPMTKTERDSSPFKVLELWQNCMAETGEEPKIVHDASFHPSLEGLKRLKINIQEVNKSGSKYDWIEKTKDDINPSLAPQFFTKAEIKEHAGTVEELEDDTLEEGFAQ